MCLWVASDFQFNHHLWDKKEHQEIRKTVIADIKACCTQAIVRDGLIHPSANESMTIRLNIPYLPSQYPPPTLQARGYVCNCAEFYDNPCRVEFRQVTQHVCHQMTLPIRADFTTLCYGEHPASCRLDMLPPFALIFLQRVQQPASSCH